MMERNEARQAILAARQALSAKRPHEALGSLRLTAAARDDVTLQAPCARLAKDIAGLLPELPALKVAFLGQVTVDHLVDLLRYQLLMGGVRLLPLILPFGTATQQVRDPDSHLYRFRPDVAWFFSHPSELHLDPGINVLEGEADGIVGSALETLGVDARAVASRSGALVIANNMPAPLARVFGNHESVLPGTYSSLLLRYNAALPKALPTGAGVLDVAHLAAGYGLERWEDARLWAHSKHPFSFGAHALVAFAAARMLLAARGGARKCIVVDLDNTLWGGVVGDDGIEGLVLGVDGGATGDAYARFQTWLRALSRRGVALAICSKNDPAIAREAFTRHAGMVLRAEDVAVFKANWENKADNIRAIAHELNIDLDAIVFVDDNRAERALVRIELPQVEVPELPEDPADYVHALAAGHWFEALAVSTEDRRRTASFRENAARIEAQSTASDLPSYLQSLEMSASWGSVDDGNLERVAQLVNKTNQFHLTTTRYTVAEIRRMADSEDHWVGRFSLVDRFGDNGIIAMVILRFEVKTAHIDTWTMSCRVFSRTMEHFTFAVIARVARQRGCSHLVGRYVPTAKNGVVAMLYPSLGAHERGQDPSGSVEWEVDLDAGLPAGSPYIRDTRLSLAPETSSDTGERQI